MREIISVKNLRKKFDNHVVFDDLSFNINEGDVVAIFGPNGAGKTTILNILAGIINKDAGEIIVKNVDKSELSYIFQNYRDSLFPWRNNYKNLAFPLKLNGKQKEYVNKQIKELQENFKITIDLNKYPYQLSGGQQQLMAFFRAFITKPKLLFIDEPFSALDYENNLLLREALQKYYSKNKPTIVIITHDIEEAVHLANKIIVLSKSPSKIVDVIENNETFPRKLSFLKTEKFNELKKRVLTAFEKGAGIGK